MEDVAKMLTKEGSEQVQLKPLAADDFYKFSVEMGGDPAYLACIRDQFAMTKLGQLEGVADTSDAVAFANAVGRAPITWKENIEQTL